MTKQIITGLDLGEVAEYVLLSGEPERIPRIAKILDNSKEIKTVREYSIYEGKADNERVTIASTGIGGPSTAILIEELANLGAKTFIRVGSSGAISDDLKKGDFVITTGAIRGDGTSRSYVWPEFPAFAHYEVVAALISAAKSRQKRFTTGITFSIDGFYSENKILGEKGELVSMCHKGFQMQDRSTRLIDVKAMGVKNIEMENATLLTLGNLYGLRAGAICTVSDVVPWRPTDAKIDSESNIQECIEIGVDAMSRIIRGDKSKGADGQ